MAMPVRWFALADLTELSATASASVLRSAVPLRVLDLAHNSIGAEGGVAIGTLLGLGSPHLRELSVEGNRLGWEGAYAIALGMERNFDVVELKLRHNFGDQAGASRCAVQLIHHVENLCRRNQRASRRLQCAPSQGVGPSAWQVCTVRHYRMHARCGHDERACGHGTAWVQDRVTAAVGAAEILCNPIASNRIAASLHRHLRAAGTESPARTVERPSPVAIDGRGGDRIGSSAALHRLRVPVLLDTSSPPSSLADARVLSPPLSIANPIRHASAASGGCASTACMRPTHSEAYSDDSLEEGDGHSRTVGAARPSAPMTQRPSARPWQRDLIALDGGGGVRASESVPTISQPRSTAKAKRDTSLDVPSFVRSASTPHGRSVCTERDEFSPSSRPTPDGARTFHLLLLMMRNHEYSPALITALGSRTFSPSLRWRG